VAWKHNDLFTGSSETRRMRRQVISTFVAIGNYDYGFFWYLHLDGRIELEVKATGVVFTSSYVYGSRWATQVVPGLGAPYHQHMFSARLDMTVDGPDNAVDELELERVPVGPGNQHGNAFTRRVTRLARESDGVRTADAGAAVTGRAAFATSHLWVTRYDPGRALRRRRPAQPASRRGGAARLRGRRS
jgi:primary-amine oxidase